MRLLRLLRREEVTMSRHWCIRLGKGHGKQHALARVQVRPLVLVVTVCGQKEDFSDWDPQRIFKGVVTCRQCLDAIGEEVTT